MVHIHELTPGVEVRNLLVEIHSLDGSDSSAKPNDPVFRATIKDATGYASLLYQASPTCKPAAIKKGRNYTVSGEHDTMCICSSMCITSLTMRYSRTCRLLPRSQRHKSSLRARMPASAPDANIIAR
jgi:hypothetical protein